MNFLLCGKAGIIDIRLNKDGTNLAVVVFGKANQTIGKASKYLLWALIRSKNGVRLSSE